MTAAANCFRVGDLVRLVGGPPSIRGTVQTVDSFRVTLNGKRYYTFYVHRCFYILHERWVRPPVMPSSTARSSFKQENLTNLPREAPEKPRSIDDFVIKGAVARVDNYSYVDADGNLVYSGPGVRALYRRANTSTKDARANLVEAADVPVEFASDAEAALFAAKGIQWRTRP